MRAETRPSILEWFLSAVAVVLALWIFITTLNLTRAGWVVVPIGDDWDRWRTYVDTPHKLEWLFKQHIDHRLVAPKLIFEIDHWFFHAQGWFTVLCTFCLQALTGILLWHLSGRVCRQNRPERLLLLAVILACLFSGQQWVNFILPFQVQFPMVYCAATLALLALWNAAQQAWRGGFWQASWIAASIASATVATYSMANGVLVWPVLLLAAFWLKMPRRWVAALAGAAVLLGASFFYHWHKAIISVELPPSERLPRAVIFLLANLGSPLSPLAMLGRSENARLAAAAIPGALLGMALLAGFTMLWRRREHFNNARAMLLFYCVFLGGSAMSMAYGRASGPLLEAFTSRYLTPAYILWLCMLLAAWPFLRRLPRVLLYATLCAAMFFGIVIHQEDIMTVIRNGQLAIPLAEAALVDNVTDPAAWPPLYHAPRIVMDAVDYLRSNRLSIFLEEWTHWPGMELKSRFLIDSHPGACQGQFEETVKVSSPLRPGWRATGWAWDVKAGRAPRYVVLAGDDGKMAGVALTEFPPPSAPAGPSQPQIRLPWDGYVNGRPQPMTAYMVEADGRSVCALGRQPLSLSSFTVEVDMLVSAGNMVQLYANEWQHRPPENLPVIPGKRHIYQFNRFPPELTLLRLDPTELPGARIVIYSVTVKIDGQIVRQFTPDDLKKWTRANLSEPKQEDGGLAMLDTNDDPILFTSVALHLP